MTELHSSPERLTPGQEFIQIIDEHFDAIGGVGEPDHRFGEERIELLAPGFKPIFGLGSLRTLDAVRTIPGHEELVEMGWPSFHGHRVRAFTKSEGSTLYLTFFANEGEIRVRGTLYDQRTKHAEPDESAMAPDLVNNFLTWLRNCTPFLPNPIADL